jgi:hypothetical protein
MALAAGIARILGRGDRLAILVMVPDRGVCWPLVAGNVDRMVTADGTPQTGGLNQTSGTPGSASTETAANLQNALLYEPWLGGEFGDADSDVAALRPAIFDGQAPPGGRPTLRTPAAGQKIIDAKEQSSPRAAAKAADPDAYEYLVGRRRTPGRPRVHLVTSPSCPADGRPSCRIL